MCFMRPRSRVFYVRLSVRGVSFLPCLFAPVFISRCSEPVGWTNAGRFPSRSIATLLCFPSSSVVSFHVDTRRPTAFPSAPCLWGGRHGESRPLSVSGLLAAVLPLCRLSGGGCARILSLTTGRQKGVLSVCAPGCPWNKARGGEGHLTSHPTVGTWWAGRSKGERSLRCGRSICGPKGPLSPVDVLRQGGR